MCESHPEIKKDGERMANRNSINGSGSAVSNLDELKVHDSFQRMASVKSHKSSSAWAKAGFSGIVSHSHCTAICWMKETNSISTNNQHLENGARDGQSLVGSNKSNMPLSKTNRATKGTHHLSTCLGAVSTTE